MAGGGGEDFQGGHNTYPYTDIQGLTGRLHCKRVWAIIEGKLSDPYMYICCGFVSSEPHHKITDPAPISDTVMDKKFPLEKKIFQRFWLIIT